MELPLFGAETSTLRRNEEKRIEAFEMWMWRRMKRVKWTDRIRKKVVLERDRVEARTWSSDEFNIPYSTLKDRLNITLDPSKMPFVKEKNSFFISGEKEAELMSYVVEMQELGFRLTATQVREFAFRLAS
ncbi:hypothetical protein ANN_03202 [Periplaneta americana]|uniref:Uncharacterized protein n=1 Tax=Periplaneta americana TaxID=6978 RepID=A0ABQ8U008_PERAM|nr:hypothetical protein ANN_03202 [Periplaneta americana]